MGGLPTESMIEHIPDAANRTGAEFIDVSINERAGTQISVQDGRADEIYGSEVFGAGIRVLIDRMSGFASTYVFGERGASQLPESRFLDGEGCEDTSPRGEEVAKPPTVRSRATMSVPRDPRDVDAEQKVRAVVELEKAARTPNSRMVNTIAGRRGREVASELVTIAGNGVYPAGYLEQLRWRRRAERRHRHRVPWTPEDLPA